MNYKKIDTDALVDAKKDGNFWRIVHADGNMTRLSDQKFTKRYVSLNQEEQNNVSRPNRKGNKAAKGA